MVFAPTRRRPWKLAREAMTVDHLSGGRLVVPVGLGALDDQGFGDVGEATGVRDRAAILDETLAILDGLWSGEPFGFQGDALPVRADDLPAAPRPGAAHPHLGGGRRGGRAVDRPRGRAGMGWCCRPATRPRSGPRRARPTRRASATGSTARSMSWPRGRRHPIAAAARSHRPARRGRRRDVVDRGRLERRHPRRRCAPGSMPDRPGYPEPHDPQHASTSSRPPSAHSSSPSTPATTRAGRPRIRSPSWPAWPIRPAPRSSARSGRTAATRTPTGTSARARRRSWRRPRPRPASRCSSPMTS